MDDHAPPPPYSETDIYSSTSTRPVLTPATSQADAASVAARPVPSSASSIDEPIYTPPFTPAASIHQNQVHGEDIDHASSSSATAYFDSRPHHNPYSGPVEVYRISVTHHTDPKDIPYPQALLAKDISEQDWKTFLNHLLPNHAVGVNNDIADRKLRAEMDDQMSRLSIGDDNRSRRSDISQVDAQLDSIRSSHTPRRMAALDSTIIEWNDGFFKLRGVQISTIDVDAEIAAGELATETRESTNMPGSWIPWEHENGDQPNGESSTTGARKGSFFGRFKQAGDLGSDTTGFKFGPIVADNEGFRIGKNGLRADSEGFRIGNLLVADSNGFRLGGSKGFNAGNHGVTLGGRSLNPREYRDQVRDHVKSRGHGHRGRSHSHGRHGKGRARDASVSSSSSSSSSSSFGSDSSLGSLPDYEDLRDQQLPVAKQSLLEWLNHPEQPITKAAVQSVKQDIKNSRRDAPQRGIQDTKALRNEVKELMKQFKNTRKTQRKQRREERRLRKAERRALKKERRNIRREERRGRRGGPGGLGRGGRGMGAPWTHPSALRPDARNPWSPPMPTVPHAMPGMFPPAPPPRALPNMPHTRSMPNMPPAPHLPGMFQPSQGGPCMPKGLFGGRNSPPGMTAMHGGWPFTQSHPYSPHGASVPLDPRDPAGPVSRSAANIHSQVYEMEESAMLKESKAFELRREATGRSIGEKLKLKFINQATELEEEAERERREADRLRAEAVHLDGELARELMESGEDEFENGSGNPRAGGQQSGVIPGAFR